MKKLYKEPTIKARRIQPLNLLAASTTNSEAASTNTATIIVEDCSTSWKSSSGNAKKASLWDSEEQ